MTKIIYFLVVVAVIAQAYAIPADGAADAAGKVAEAPAAAEKQAQGAAPAPPAGAPEMPPGLDFFKPIIGIVKSAAEQGQKAFTDFTKVIPGK